MRNGQAYEPLVTKLGRRRRARCLLHLRCPSASSATTDQPSALTCHTAEGYELVLAVRGRARIGSSAETFELTPGRLLLIERGVWHEEMPCDPPCHYELFWCHVNHTLVRLDRTTYAPPSRFHIEPSVELEGSRYLENTVRAMADELTHKELGWLDSTHGLLQYLAFAIVRRIRRGEAVYLRDASTPIIAADLRVWRTVQAALQFCDANFRRPVNARDVAAAVGYSPSYLARLFSRHLGRSISEHLRGLRMTTARHMLETTDLPIAEIASAIGYSDHSHFTRAFTRFTGMPPKDCRRDANSIQAPSLRRPRHAAIEDT